MEYENEMTFKVLSYDTNLGYHFCVDEHGKTHWIDLNVASVFQDVNDEWFIGKTFFGEVKPYKYIAYRFEEVKFG